MYDQALSLSKEQKEEIKEIALPSCKWHKEKFCHKIMLLPGISAIVVRFQKDEKGREKICHCWFYPASIAWKSEEEILNWVTGDLLNCWEDVKEEMSRHLAWFSEFLKIHYPDQMDVEARAFYRVYFSLRQEHRNCEDNIKALEEFKSR